MSRQFFTLSPDQHQVIEHIIQHHERLDIRKSAAVIQLLADGTAQEVCEQTTRLPQWAIYAVYITLLAKGLEGLVKSINLELTKHICEGLIEFLNEMNAYYGSDE